MSKSRKYMDLGHEDEQRIIVQKKSFSEKYNATDKLGKKAMIAKELNTSYGNLECVLQSRHTTWEEEGRRLCQTLG